jgi:hypothetical protein
LSSLELSESTDSVALVPRRLAVATKVIEYRFKIDAFTPETIPMQRLAAYMADLATLLGSQEKVHFDRTEGGSVVLVQKIETDAVSAVRQRLVGVKKRTAPEDAIRAFGDIDKKLLEDKAIGVLEADTGKQIEFPGRNRALLNTFAPIVEHGSLDGRLIRVGGRDETVPVYLEEGDVIHKCNSNREMAKKLAPFLFEGPLRVWGSSRWYRDQFGNWVMERFTITDFEQLDDSSLTATVSKLRAVPDSGLESHNDPFSELRRIRQG